MAAVEYADETYLAAIQVTIQKDKKERKVRSITNIPKELTNGMCGVFFILINPLWTNIDEMYTITSQTISHRNEMFLKYWYGQPKDYTQISALLMYLRSIFGDIESA